MIITKEGHIKLQNEVSKLLKIDLQEAIKELELTRPYGVSDEFPPEYIQALDNVNIIENKINALNEMLSKCEVFNTHMIKHKDRVGFGATVTIKNLNNDRTIKFTIVSSYESDVNNGLISVESPMAQEMMDLIIDDEFEVNGTEYSILSIVY